MTTTRRQFVFNSMGIAALGVGPLHPLFGKSIESPLGGSVTDGSYGSGHFGKWIEDEFGLPAFHYTCDQIIDPKAVTSVTPGILSPTEHVHQVGNDRITAIVSNYGHVRVRQDEGSPKFLNDYAPETSQFGGGIGYLTDGQETLSTFYSANNAQLDRIFGVGYLQKKLTGKNCSIDQVISAPFGDDPVLLSQVTITNHGTAPAALRWIEYWGCQPYQFSFRSFIESWSGMASAVELRRRFAQRFSHHIRRMDGNYGLVETKQFLGRAPEEEAVWEKMKASLAAHPTDFVSPIQATAPGTSFDDLNPPATFLLSLDAPADGFGSEDKNFFGPGGAANPSGLSSPLNGEIGSSEADSALLLERRVHLNPGEKTTLYFLYGYLPEGVEIDSLAARYRSMTAATLKESSAQWKRKGLHFSVESEPWVNRETIWNHYCLRSSLTYDEFFNEHILNQSGFYQYVMGFQGAARDPLQHCLPFVFSDPEIVKSVLRYTLKEVRPDGSIPYAMVGHGTVAPLVTDNSSDMPLWLLWTVSEYVLATRDSAFLDEEIPMWPHAAATTQKESVRNLLARCFRHQINDVGVGEHGIVRMLNDDWNDGLLAIWAQKAFKECVEQGESVLNSAMSAWVFDLYARLLSYANASSDQIAEIRRNADANREAARKQWTGKWLRRAWLGPTLGWMGEKNLWIEPQPWAILAGVTSPSESRELIRAIDELLRVGPLGAVQLSQGPDMIQGGIFAPGTSTNGGIWPSLNQTLIWALALHDPAMAWDEWKKNSLARHAEEYPNVWYGTLSGPDTYNSTFSKQPGETVNNLYFHGTDFPVLNLHSHACALYSSAKLIGIEFTEAGLNLRPGLPVESYRFESALVGVIKSTNGHYEGWYAPSQPGAWTVTITLPAKEALSLSHAEVNGMPVQLKKISDGVLELQGTSEKQKAMRWLLR